MKEAYKNKAVETDKVETKGGVQNSYSFPEHGVTVKATSYEEALEKLKAILIKN